jgi:hypothetical protein
MQWITNAIEYRKLIDREYNKLLTFVTEFAKGKYTKTSEDELEQIFAEVQWREDKELPSVSGS